MKARVTASHHNHLITSIPHPNAPRNNRRPPHPPPPPPQRIETLDPALIRPGRIDRKIEFPLPDAKTKRRIFTIHTSELWLCIRTPDAPCVRARACVRGVPPCSTPLIL